MKYFYHGTSSDRLESIMRDGKIKCSCDLTPMERVFKSATSDKNGVFVSTSRRIALSWARIATSEPLVKGDKPQGVILRIPEKDGMEVVDDPLFYLKEKKHFMIKGNVEDFEVYLKFNPLEKYIKYTNIYKE